MTLNVKKNLTIFKINLEYSKTILNLCRRKINNTLKRRKMFVLTSSFQSFTPTGFGATLLRGLFQS